MFNKIKEMFKKGSKNTNKESAPANQQQQKKFMEASSIEEFKEMYIRFHKQELALENDVSYFDVGKSNVDGSFFGEMFDKSFTFIK